MLCHILWVRFLLPSFYHLLYWLHHHPLISGPWTNPVLVTQEAYEKAKITASPRKKKPKLDKGTDVISENMKQEEMDTNNSAVSDNKEGAPVVLLSSVGDSLGLQQVYYGLLLLPFFFYSIQL